MTLANVFARLASTPPTIPDIPLGRSVLLFDEFIVGKGAREGVTVITARLVTVAADDPLPAYTIGSRVEWSWFFRDDDPGSPVTAYANINAREFVAAVASDLDDDDAARAALLSAGGYRGRCVMATVEGERRTRAGKIIRSIRWCQSNAEPELLIAAAERAGLAEPDESRSADWMRVASEYRAHGWHHRPGPVRS